VSVNFASMVSIILRGEMDKKKLLLATIISFICFSIVVGVFQIVSNSDENGTQTTDEISNIDDVDILNNLSTVSDPYTVYISVTDQDGVQFDLATVEVLNEQTSQTIIDDGVELLIFIIDGNDFYSYTDEVGWVKFTDEELAANADYAQSYRLSDEQIAELTEGAQNQGAEPCGESTCEIYESSDDQSSSKLKIDKQTNRIVEITRIEEGETFVVTYDYDSPVQFEIPSDFVDVTGEI
jgi:hypothetical protein